VLILLPPSEGKAEPAKRGRPVDLTSLPFPQLTGIRRTILDAVLARAEPPSNARLADRPAAAAGSVYTGVLYAALGYSTLGPGAKRRAHGSILVQSALWGPIGLADRIVPYKLAMDAPLTAVGPLAARWRAVLGPVLTERAGSGVVVDCRSATYAAAWRPTGDVARRTVTVRVFTEINGRRTTVSHWAKHTRGEVARWLLEAPRAPETVAAVAKIVGGHVRCELVDLGRAGRALDIVL